MPTPSATLTATKGQDLPNMQSSNPGAGFDGANKMKRIYLAGPCSGLPELNFPAFHAEAARLRSLGYEVVSPAEINSDAAPSCGDHFAHWVRCMKLDIPHLLTCDTIAFLPGFLNSDGSFVELFLAKSFRLNRCISSEINQGPAA